MKNNISEKIKRFGYRRAEAAFFRMGLAAESAIIYYITLNLTRALSFQGIERARALAVAFAAGEYAAATIVVVMGGLLLLRATEGNILNN